ncbi:MAG: serine protease [Alphaproteobacteria bacterium]|nr:serine protease [Alphaproteobacteria bacterium]
MSDQTPDILTQLSAAVAARSTAAAPLVASLHAARGRIRSATLWRPDVAIASEQVLPRGDTAELVLADGRHVAAQVAGRDRGTNIAALRLPTPVEIAPPILGEAQLGGLVLTLAADAAGAPLVRLAVVRGLGPAWHSLAGGRIDRRILLDLAVSRREEGGPVFDATGRLLGISTGGPGGRALVIPAATIERVVPALLAQGRIDRGWLGAALHPVLLPDAVKAGGQERGLMVMRVAPDGPAGKAGVIPGDILLALDGAAAARPTEIARRLGPESVGRQVELRLLRAGAVQTLAVSITPRPPQ